MPYASVINFVAFQLVWMGCVAGAAQGYPWLGPGLLAGSLLLQQLIPLHWRLLGLAAAIGVAGEWALHKGGVTGYPPQAWTGEPIPVWMVALWVNFASTLSRSLSWLQGRYVAAAALGALAGPLSYWGGERLGAITLNPDPAVWAGAIGLMWTVATPLLVWSSEAA